jgi:hypothetical protein
VPSFYRRTVLRMAGRPHGHSLAFWIHRPAALLEQYASTSTTTRWIGRHRRPARSGSSPCAKRRQGVGVSIVSLRRTPARARLASRSWKAQAVAWEGVQGCRYIARRLQFLSTCPRASPGNDALLPFAPSNSLHAVLIWPFVVYPDSYSHWFPGVAPSHAKPLDRVFGCPAQRPRPVTESRLPPDSPQYRIPTVPVSSQGSNMAPPS